MKKKIIASILALTMVLSSMSFNVFASETFSETDSVLTEAESVDDLAVDVVEDADETNEESDVSLAASAVNEAVSVADETVSDSAIDLDTAVTEGWNVGMISKDGTSPVTISGDYSTKVTILNNQTSATKGKWSNGEDQIGYYGTEIDASKDFTLTADVVVDAFADVNPTEKSRTQSSGGLAVFSSVEYVKPTYHNVAAALYAPNSNSGTYMKFYGCYRDGSEKRTRVWSEPLSGNVVSVDGGTPSKDAYKLSIAKRGDLYVVSCGDNSYTIKDNGNLPSEGKIYPMLFATRQCAMTFSNIKLDVDDKEMEALEITTLPDKNEFVIGDAPDLTGMVVTATYKDGSKEILAPDQYAVDVDTSAPAGQRKAYIKKGQFSLPLDVTYSKNRVVKLNILEQPVKNEYFIGTKIDPKGLKVEAELLNKTVELKDEEYELSIGGKPLTEDYFVDKNTPNSFRVKFITTESTDAGSAYADVPINVMKDYSIDYLSLLSEPVVTTYYIGDKFDTTGLKVKANYTNANGSPKYDILDDDEYILELVTTDSQGKEVVLPVDKFDSSAEKDYEVRIRYIADKSKMTSYYISVKSKKIIKAALTGYPVTSYEINPSGTARSDFDMTGIEYSYYLSSGETAPIELRKIIYAQGDEEVINPKGAYDIDLRRFQTSKESVEGNYTSFIDIVHINPEYEKVELPVTVKKFDKNYWRGASFGESTSSAKNKITGDVSNIENGAKVNLLAQAEKKGDAAGGGKLSTDQDGISFVYTRVDAKNNFKLSADVTVKGYLLDGNCDDTTRAGQEGFGIMARDNVMLSAADGSGITATASKAKKDSDGEPVPLNSGTVFCGNFAAVGGMTFTAYPKDQSSSSFEKNRDLNRVNLGVRYGCESWETSKVGSPTRELPVSTMSQNMFKKGDKYRLTLERVNGGYKATCYDYQTDDTQVRAFYPVDGEILTTIDPDNIYVGFFVARLAEIDVENVEFSMSDPSTDIVATIDNVAKVTPRLSVSSSNYSTETLYNLVVKPNNKSGGYVTIKQEDTVIVKDAFVSKGSNVFPTNIKPDGETTFRIYYTPKIVSETSVNYEELTSTDESSQIFTVTHKGDFNSSAEIIYTAPSPKGSFSGDGTRAKPYDLDTALGFVEKGQTIIMMDGVYLRNDTITVPSTKSGTIVERIKLIADEGATPIIDAQNEYLGMTLEASNWDVKGIHFRNSGNNLRGFQLSGDNCVIENCKFYDNGDTGFQLSRTSGDANSMDWWPKNNIIKNCEVWNSADPAGINADGFGCKLTVGVGNKFIGCVSHHNGDDGWDLYTKSGTGPIAVVVLENCMSYKQGYELLPSGESVARKSGGHNGLKLGGEGVAVPHVIRNCKTFMNESAGAGISSNSNPCLVARDCVSYMNEGANVSLYSETNLTDPEIIDRYTVNGEKAGHTLPKGKAQNYDLKGVVSYRPAGTASDKVGAYTPASYNYLATVVTKTIKDENGKNVKVPVEDYSKNSDGKEVNDSFFKRTSLDGIMTNWHFAQDKDGNFITDGFLEFTDDVKASFAADSNYADPVETTETTTEWTKDMISSSNRGGGSAKRNSSSSVSNSSSDKNNDKTDSDKAESDKTDKDKTDKDKAEADKAESDKTETDKTDKTESDKTETDKSENDGVQTGKADKFTDIQNSWAKPYVSALIDAGVINGITDTTFAPDAKITRGDFTKILVKALGVTSNEAHGFTDVAANDYYNEEIAAAKAFGLVKGTSPVTFGPKENITRQDAVTIIARTIESIGAPVNDLAGDLTKFADSMAISEYAKAPFEKLVGLGFVNGSNGMLNPKVNITRAEAAKLIYDLMQISKSGETE